MHDLLYLTITCLVGIAASTGLAIALEPRTQPARVSAEHRARGPRQ